MFARFSYVVLFAAAVAAAASSWTEVAAERPHVVLVMADDLGYGDVRPLNPDSTIPTPAFDLLAEQGITFTDAHTPSAVCTPTRYGLLTGRYCWRSSLKKGVLNGYGKPLIETDRPTLASVLKSAGYRTAIVGKWHLGLGLTFQNGQANEKGLDLSKPLTYHPGSVGFDSSLVLPASLDFPPYVYFRDGKPTTTETVSQAATPFPPFLRKGPRAVDFIMRESLDYLTDHAVQQIASMKDATQPSFLYFPLTAPHKPVLPSKQFAGTSSLGPYGDFVRQVDHTIGRVIEAIEDHGLAENTLLIVTSDNGSYMYRIKEGQADHVDDPKIQGFRPDRHQSNQKWRGTKADIWEAGHRVPFFVRMPAHEHAGTHVDAVVGLVDIMATLMDHLEIEPIENAGPDSVSFASLLDDPTTAFSRPPLICHSVSGMFAIRDGRWKLIAGNGSGGREAPKGKPFEEPWMLFDLDSDPSETDNVAEHHPDVVAQLKSQLLQMKGTD